MNHYIFTTVSLFERLTEEQSPRFFGNVTLHLNDLAYDYR